jgi:hypothetical protein
MAWHGMAWHGMAAVIDPEPLEHISTQHSFHWF